MVLSCYQIKNTDDNSFDKTILHPDSKKIIQHHFKLTKNACKEKEIFDVMINVRSCSITRQVTLYLVNHVNILMERNKVFAYYLI